MTHELKIQPQYFKEVISGLKTFEIRKNDRDFCVGDRLVLKEWENDKYTGRTTIRTISYMTDYMQKKGCIVTGKQIGRAHV